jgi:hypothetical protein
MRGSDADIDSKKCELLTQVISPLWQISSCKLAPKIKKIHFFSLKTSVERAFLCREAYFFDKKDVF